MSDLGVENAADAALAMVADGMRVGLGTGHAATSFVTRLGDRVRSGLRIVGIPTSDATATLAASLGITLGTLDESDDELALTVDGADEVSPDLDLVKGFGGALVRERIVAAASRRQVIVVGHDKLVDRLGTRGRIPIEVDAVRMQTRAPASPSPRPHAHGAPNRCGTRHLRERQSHHRLRSRRAVRPTRERRARSNGSSAPSRASSTPDSFSARRTSCWSAIRAAASTCGKRGAEHGLGRAVILAERPPWRRRRRCARRPETPGCASHARQWVLAATILGSSLAFMMASIINVALPAIQETFGATRRRDAVGGERLHRPPGRADAGRRRHRRPLRTAARVPGRNRRPGAGLDRGQPRAERARPHRGAGGAGTRGRAARAEQPGAC